MKLLAHYARWHTAVNVLAWGVLLSLLVYGGMRWYGFPHQRSFPVAAAWWLVFSVSYVLPVPKHVPQDTFFTILIPTFIALVGILLPLIPLVALYSGQVAAFQPSLAQVLLFSGLLGVATTLGGLTRGWPQLLHHDRTWAVLYVQLMLWPMVLLEMIQLGFITVGLHPRAVDLLTEAFYLDNIVPVALVVAGMYTAIRLWKMRLPIPAAGTAIFWSTVVAWLFFFKLLVFDFQ